MSEFQDIVFQNILYEQVQESFPSWLFGRLLLIYNSTHYITPNIGKPHCIILFKGCRQLPSSAECRAGFLPKLVNKYRILLLKNINKKEPSISLLPLYSSTSR